MNLFAMTTGGYVAAAPPAGPAPAAAAALSRCANCAVLRAELVSVRAELDRAALLLLAERRRAEEAESRLLGVAGAASSSLEEMAQAHLTMKHAMRRGAAVEAHLPALTPAAPAVREAAGGLGPAALSPSVVGASSLAAITSPALVSPQVLQAAAVALSASSPAFRPPGAQENQRRGQVAKKIKVDEKAPKEGLVTEAGRIIGAYRTLSSATPPVKNSTEEAVNNSPSPFIESERTMAKALQAAGQKRKADPDAASPAAPPLGLAAVATAAAAATARASAAPTPASLSMTTTDSTRPPSAAGAQPPPGRRTPSTNPPQGKEGAGPGAASRRGDPRMNRAVDAKLANPSVSLFDALVRGGFVFPPMHPGESGVENGNSDKTTVDTEGVTLYQRKNQLNRRLRRLKGDRAQGGAAAAVSRANSGLLGGSVPVAAVALASH